MSKMTESNRSSLSLWQCDRLDTAEGEEKLGPSTETDRGQELQVQLYQLDQLQVQLYQLDQLQVQLYQVQLQLDWRP
jgi:hypothetical protein